jgi:hypothetical protein
MVSDNGARPHIANRHMVVLGERASCGPKPGPMRLPGLRPGTFRLRLGNQVAHFRVSHFKGSTLQVMPCEQSCHSTGTVYAAARFFG